MQNKMGIHARPAAMIVRITNKFKAEVFVENKDEQVNGKSIMGLMMLAAGRGPQGALLVRGVGGYDGGMNLDFSEDEISRYSRHILLREVGGVGQAKLREARDQVALHRPDDFQFSAASAAYGGDHWKNRRAFAVVIATNSS